MRSSILLLIALGLVGCSSKMKVFEEEDAGRGPDPSLDDAGLDVQAPDARIGDGGCDTLRIGIFGNPGALQSSNFQQWLTKAGTSAKRVQQGSSDVLKPADLVAFDVVILDRLQHDYNAAEVAALETFVKNGGGLVAMTGYDNTSNDFRANALLAPLGVKFNESAFLNGPVTTFYPHPITKGLTSVSFYGGYDVQLTTTKNTVTRTKLGAIGPDVVSYAVELGKGRAFVFGDEWIEFDSEWQMLPEIQKLWVQVFKWVGPMTGCDLKPPPPPN